MQEEVSQNVGISLRPVLHPVSVLFELSPSVIIRDRASATNQKTTESTSKFAVTASMVKVKPMQKNGVLDFDSIVKEIREHEIVKKLYTWIINHDKINKSVHNEFRAPIIWKYMYFMYTCNTFDEFDIEPSIEYFPKSFYWCEDWLFENKETQKNNSNQYNDPIADIDDPLELNSSFGAKRTKFEKTPVTVIEDFECYKLNNPTKIDTKSENKLLRSTKSGRNLVCDNEGHMIPERCVTVNLYLLIVHINH